MSKRKRHPFRPYEVSVEVKGTEDGKGRGAFNLDMSEELDFMSEEKESQDGCCKCVEREIEKTNELLQRGRDLLDRQAEFIMESTEFIMESNGFRVEETGETAGTRALVKMAKMLQSEASRVVNYSFAFAELWAIYSLLILAKNFPAFPDVDQRLVDGFLLHCRDVYIGLGLTEEEADTLVREYETLE